MTCSQHEEQGCKTAKILEILFLCYIYRHMLLDQQRILRFPKVEMFPVHVFLIFLLRLFDLFLL